MMSGEGDLRLILSGACRSARNRETDGGCNRPIRFYIWVCWESRRDDKTRVSGQHPNCRKGARCFFLRLGLSILQAQDGVPHTRVSLPSLRGLLKAERDGDPVGFRDSKTLQNIYLHVKRS